MAWQGRTIFHFLAVQVFVSLEIRHNTGRKLVFCSQREFAEIEIKRR